MMMILLILMIFDDDDDDDDDDDFDFACQATCCCTWPACGPLLSALPLSPLPGDTHHQLPHQCVKHLHICRYIYFMILTIFMMMRRVKHYDPGTGQPLGLALSYFAPQLSQDTSFIRWFSFP